MKDIALAQSPNKSPTEHLNLSQSCSKVFKGAFCSPGSSLCRVESEMPVLREDC